MHKYERSEVLVDSSVFIANIILVAVSAVHADLLVVLLQSSHVLPEQYMCGTRALL